MKPWTKDAPHCEECKCQHWPVAERCPFKIERDALVHLNASGACFSWAMLERMVLSFKIKLPPPQYAEMRLVSANPRAMKFMGLDWVTDKRLPPNMIICETGRAHGVLSNLLEEAEAK